MEQDTVLVIEDDEAERSSDETFLFGLTRLLEGISAYAASHANHERER